MDTHIIDRNSAYRGVPQKTLMDNAGRAVADEVSAYTRILILAGNGNNGGDGYACAHHLLNQKKEVAVYKLAGDAKEPARQFLDKLPKRIVYEITDADELPDLSTFDVVVDALVGVGLTGPLRRPLAEIAAAVNASGRPVVSVDVPSGGIVDAEKVVCLHSPKVDGCVTADIGVPAKAETHCGPGDVLAVLPERCGDAHKGDFGRLVIAGGCRNYTGTTALVADAAAAVGTDLIVQAVPQYVADHLPMRPDYIVEPLPDENHLTVDGARHILALPMTALAVGNGLGRNEQTRDAVNHLLEHAECPVVVDADALRLLEPTVLSNKMVLTPHRGEYQHLFGAVDDAPAEHVRNAGSTTGATIILKGPEDVISDGDAVRFNDAGSPYMSCGGTGDVLAGAIAGLLAQGNTPLQSACAGAFLVGLAGERAAAAYYEATTASHVTAHIHEALRECRSYR